MITEAEAVVERFGYVYATAMLFALGAGLFLGSAAPVLGVAAAAFFAFARAHRGRFTPAGTFGAANAVTLLRFALIAALPWLEPLPGPRSAACLMAIFALDGIDGLLARRGGQVSEFGARFDMECDALLVLVAGLVLYLRGRLPAFILLPGTLRYLYALSLAIAPQPAREPPRSRLGRYAFSAMVVSLAASLWPVPLVHPPLALAATLLLSASFARSWLEAFRRA